MSCGSSIPCAASRAQSGSVLVTVLIVLVPLLLVIGATISLFTTRNSKLLNDVQQQKALLAASAGVELAAQSAQAGTLISGASVANDLGKGLACTYVATYLGNDTQDNDADGLTDEADERAFEVISSGTNGRVHRRVSAILVENGLMPPFGAAILTLGLPTIRTSGSARISGLDTMISGLPAPVPSNVQGIATEPPNTGAQLKANYVGGGSSVVNGLSPTPSIGAIAAPYNLPGLAAVVRNRATQVLTPGVTYKNLGNALTNDWRLSYCPGNLSIQGTTGAGILLVTGNLTITGGLRFDGLVIVMGTLTLSGGPVINGAMIQGKNGGSIRATGGAIVRYSTEALNRIRALIPPDYVIETWREIAR